MNGSGIDTFGMFILKNLSRYRKGFCGTGVPPAVFGASLAAANCRRDAGATKSRGTKPIRGNQAKSPVSNALQGPMDCSFRAR